MATAEIWAEEMEAVTAGEMVFVATPVSLVAKVDEPPNSSYIFPVDESNLTFWRLSTHLLASVAYKS